MSCIKTLLLAAVKADLETIAAIKKVKLNPAILPKVDDELSRPFTCIFDEPETRISIKNRYRESTFTLWTETWFYSDTQDEMPTDTDEIHAQIQMKMLSDASSYWQYRIKTEETHAEKVFSNENECALINKYDITYRTKYGDPYSINP